VLSGNRNFEGRINPDVKMNYLASPPLVIAYALAGTMDFDFDTDPLGRTPTATTSSCATSGPRPATSRRRSQSSLSRELFEKDYADVFAGDERGRDWTPRGHTFEWDADSTYVRKPPYFDGHEREPAPVTDISGRARAGQAG
jgi:aconitate hydratase